MKKTKPIEPPWVRAMRGEDVVRGNVAEYVAETIQPDANGKHPRRVKHFAEGVSRPSFGEWLTSLGPGWRATNH